MKEAEERFILFDDDKMPILSKKTSEVHGLITINSKNFEDIKEEIFNDELISGKQHLNVDETIVPRIMVTQTCTNRNKRTIEQRTKKIRKHWSY